MGIANHDGFYLGIVLVERGDLAAVEGEIAADLLGFAVGLLVGPGGVFRDLVADFQRPVARVALERTMRMEFRFREQVHADVCGREVVRGRQARLVDHQRAPGIGDAGAVELHPHPPLAGHEADLVAAAALLAVHRYMTFLVTEAISMPKVAMPVPAFSTERKREMGDTGARSP